MTQRGVIWAPWRSAFVYRAKRQGERCVFCTAQASKDDRRHRVVARGNAVFALLNLYPYTNGHLMVAPYRHVGTVERLRSEEWSEALEILRALIGRLQMTVRPQGFNIGINLGRAAGAGIPGHLHIHVVPRWRGDANFMPVVGETRVISQSLDELYALLAGAETRGARGRAPRHRRGDRGRRRPSGRVGGHP